MTLSLREIMKKHQIQRLWHFTDETNLASIRDHGGLLSLKKMAERGIRIPRPGGDEMSRYLDKKYGLDGYVRLCFRPSHPMLYVAQQEGRIAHPVWIKIDSSVMLDRNVRFSIGVTYQDGVKLIDHEEASNNIDFDVLFTITDWNDPETQKRLQLGEKTEILVPEIVPLNMIIWP